MTHGICCGCQCLARSARSSELIQQFLAEGGVRREKFLQGLIPAAPTMDPWLQWQKVAYNSAWLQIWIWSWMSTVANSVVGGKKKFANGPPSSSNLLISHSNPHPSFLALAVYPNLIRKSHHRRKPILPRLLNQWRSRDAPRVLQLAQAPTHAPPEKVGDINK